MMDGELLRRKEIKKLIVLGTILQAVACGQLPITQVSRTVGEEIVAVPRPPVRPAPPPPPPPTATPPKPNFEPDASFKYFMLQKDMKWEIGNTGVVIEVPAGFVTDLASVPQALWSFGLSSTDKYTRAAIIHDYLYWTQSCSKVQSDNLLSIAMKESDVGWVKQTPIYVGVIAGGQTSWDKNSEEFKNGWPKIAPPKWRDIPDGIDWGPHRKAMRTNGVRDTPVAKNLPYCEYGNSTSVPFDPKRPPSTINRYDEAGNLVKVVIGQR